MVLRLMIMMKRMIMETMTMMKFMLKLEFRVTVAMVMIKLQIFQQIKSLIPNLSCPKGPH